MLRERYNNITSYGSMVPQKPLIEPAGLQHKLTQDNEYNLVSIGDIKTFLPVNHDRHDEMIRGMLKSATLQCERFVGYPFLKKDYVAYWNWAGYYVELPLSYQAVTSVKLIDDDGTETATTDYKSQGLNSLVLYFNSYADKAVKVEFTAGIADSPDEVAEDIKNAVLHQIGFLYANRVGRDVDLMAIDGISVQSHSLLTTLREQYL